MIINDTKHTQYRGNAWVFPYIPPISLLNGTQDPTKLGCEVVQIQHDGVVAELVGDEAR